ncbi:MAG: biopolymer transporter ExbD [Methanobacteriaceae archaeon]|jgi:biopolymer transport protein ExbD|nr:biopolymer transporter ExbD [Methanobacteriaceae archaeon]MDO9043935.1 biopolymer transporter ExbD [Methanobacteriaceae archaeon]MDO9627038.1 biopolymer transporter ExbD [Methanobacteriaceae archaeon]MDP2837067.1 biopolymer transporter ExbD [Methanobacteriaceae archaeon]MDP3034040.1 biopolymer transporter ExbD [Methanobacteriaceae archaeon]
MAIDVDKYRKKLKGNNPRFNMVPFIDILFTILIFVIVTSSFQAADTSSSGKPQQTESMGPSDYYLIPVAGLETVTVNGVNVSNLIKDSSIAVHTRVIDEGEIIIKPKNKMIIITTPPGMSVNEAVKSPSNI